MTDGFAPAPGLQALSSPHALKLGVFSLNADGGLAFTDVPERWAATWDDNVAAAEIADRAGLDFLLPIARWRGFGGTMKTREHSFETFTWAAGLAASTKNITIFTTVHVPLMHPLYAAKALATVDHISHGRAGLNIVCGWNPDEFAMFGTGLSERGYAQAAEWIDILERVYGATVPVDFDGEFYQLHQAVSRPSSVQKPRPVTMNAAFGPAGRDFAAAHCDCLFTSFGVMADGPRHVLDIQARAAKADRAIGVFTIGHVVCRPSQDEAEAYYHRYTVEHADDAALDYHIEQKMKAGGDNKELAQYRQRFAGGTGSYPLVGTPAKIAADLATMHAQGYQGIALSFVNYKDELPYFCETVVPLLEAQQLRVAMSRP
jgi:alkanesulfonate monooxygenase SsuD/methylene tetrahydromethanopterin reductase-like flavin-dependent oxidoreductase (luciferase family)